MKMEYFWILYNEEQIYFSFHYQPRLKNWRVITPKLSVEKILPEPDILSTQQNISTESGQGTDAITQSRVCVKHTRSLCM